MLLLHTWALTPRTVCCGCTSVTNRSFCKAEIVLELWFNYYWDQQEKVEGNIFPTWRRRKDDRPQLRPKKTRSKSSRTIVSKLAVNVRFSGHNWFSVSRDQQKQMEQVPRASLNFRTHTSASEWWYTIELRGKKGEHAFKLWLAKNQD